MKKIPILFISWLLGACSGGCATANPPSAASPTQASRARHEPGESFIAPAPRGISLNDLGRPFTRDFRRLQGAEGQSVFPKAGAPRRTAQHAFEHYVETIDSWEEWAAHAAVWGFSGDAGNARAKRFASYRAVQVVEVYEIDDTTAMARAPQHAVYYPWRIYMGRSYEVVIHGSAERFHAGAKASLPVFSGGIDDFVGRYELEHKVHGRGLRPSRDQAIFARTASEIESSYVPTADEPVEVLVEWRRIPGREGHVEAIEWTKLREGCAGNPGCETCRRWSFDRIEVEFPRRKSDGRAWDADGSAPDTVLTLRVGRDERVSTKEETYARTWVLSPPATVQVGEELMLRAIDSDLVADDPMFTLRVEVHGMLDRGRLDFGSGTAVAVGRCVDPESRGSSGTTRRLPARAKNQRSR